MKTILTILIIAATANISNAQWNNISEENYGIKINNFKTGSGFKMGTEASVYVELNRRSLEAGVFYDYESNNISGINVEHDISFLKTRINQKQILTSYFFYNFIVRNTRLHTSDFTDPTIGAHFDKSSVISMEHHIGLGCKFKITNNVFLNGSFGYGRYLGSVKKATQPTAELPLVNGVSGWGEIFKFGIGFNL